MIPSPVIQINDKIELSEYIENRLMSGRPHIKGRRIPVTVIIAFAEQWTIAQVADEFDISEQAVLASLFYASRHEAEIIAFLNEDEAIAQAGRQKMSQSWQKALHENHNK